MPDDRPHVARCRGRPWLAAASTGLAVTLLAAEPAPLIPIARAYRALCEEYPVLALLTNHTPPLPLALLLTLAALALLSGGWAGMVGLVATLRFNRRLRCAEAPLPARLAHMGNQLGLAEQLTFLELPVPMAFCYGLRRARVAVTAPLLARLDDEELLAVLAHEHHHRRRRDPRRYLALDALSAAAFMFPLAAALRERLEARIELDADRAALAIASRGALAGALLAVLDSSSQRVPGVARLGATEARIAHLAGRQALPPIPILAVVASLALAAMIVLATIDLTRAADLVRMLCPLCPGGR